MKPMVRFASMLVLLVAVSPAFAQKTKPKTSTAPTLGTVQLPGDNGKLKTTYQLGDKQSELHFTLESAAVDTFFPSPDDMLVAGAKERLLVLKFSVQNPLNREQKLASSSFQFTVVSPDDENFEFHGYLLQATKKTHLDQSLKPAQKVKCTVVIPIYAAGPVSKLMVQRGTSKLLRYDLTGKVDKMTSVFSRDGIDLLDTGTTLKKMDNGAVMGPFAINFEGTSTTTEAIKGVAPGPGESYLCIDVAFTNVMLKPVSIGFQYFTPQLIDANGEKISWNRDLISRKMDASVGQEVGPGESVAARYYFKIPAGKAPKVCRFTHEPSQRTVGLELPGLGN
jgi:hypothetical protein